MSEQRLAERRSDNMRRQRRRPVVERKQKWQKFSPGG